MYHKYTTGIVDQEFNADGECVAQEFVAGDDAVYYGNCYGEPLDIDGRGEQYQSFDMVQPFNNLLEEPLTNKQLEADQNIDVVIAVPLSSVFNYDFENLMDYFETNILENAILLDITYKMVGCNQTTDIVYFHVEALAEQFT